MQNGVEVSTVAEDLRLSVNNECKRLTQLQLHHCATPYSRPLRMRWLSLQQDVPGIGLEFWGARVYPQLVGVLSSWGV